MQSPDFLLNKNKIEENKKKDKRKWEGNKDIANFK